MAVKQLSMKGMTDLAARLIGVNPSQIIDISSDTITFSNDASEAKTVRYSISSIGEVTFSDLEEDGGFVAIEFALDEDASEDGDMVVRSGKLFEAGDYPDKNFSLSEEELAVAAAGFEPVKNDLEHRPTILDDSLGEVTAVEARGRELFGSVKIPRWLDSMLKDKPIKTSLTWDRTTKKIVGNSLVRNPRITDAQLVAAFYSDDQERDEHGRWASGGPSGTAKSDGMGGTVADGGGIGKFNTSVRKAISNAPLRASKSAVDKSQKTLSMGDKANDYDSHMEASETHSELESMHAKYADVASKFAKHYRDGKDSGGAKEYEDAFKFHSDMADMHGELAYRHDAKAMSIQRKSKSKFSAESAKNGGKNMSLKDKLLALFGAKKPEEVTDDEVTAIFSEEKSANAEPDKKDDAEFAVDPATLAAMQRRLIGDAADKQFGKLLADGRAFPAERDTFVAAFSQAVIDDAGEKACFADDGSVIEGTRTKMLCAVYASRVPHGMTTEQLASFSQEPMKSGKMSEDRRAELDCGEIPLPKKN